MPWSMENIAIAVVPKLSCMEMTQEFFVSFVISLGQAERAERWRREPQKVPEDLDDNLDLGGGEDKNVVEDQGVVNEDFDGVEDGGDVAVGDDGQIS